MEKKPIALCLNCVDHYPSIYFTEDDNIKINCICTKDPTIMKIREYLDFLKSHPERICTYQPEKIKEDTDPDKFVPSKFKSNVKKANCFLQTYLSSLKDQYISVPGVKEAYEKCITRNKDIIELKQLLCENIPPFDYRNHLSLKRHACFNFNPYIENKNNPNGIVEYFTLFNFGTMQTFKEVKVEHCVQAMIVLQDKRIAICGENDAITIVNPSNDFKIEMSLKGHTNVTIISLIQLDNGYLVSQTEYGGEVKIWSLGKDTYECLFTFYYQNPFWGTILLSKNRFAFSENNNLLIFSGVPPFSYQPIMQGDLEDNAKAVIGIKEKDIVLAMSEQALYKYDIKEEVKLIDKISVEPKKHFLTKDIKQFDDERVVFGGINKLYIINFETMKIEKEVASIELLGCTGFLKMRDPEYLFGLCQANKFFILHIKKEKLIVLKSDDFMGLFYNTVQVDDNIIVLGQSIGYLKCIKY